MKIENAQAISFVNVFEQFLRAFSRLVQKLFSTEKKKFFEAHQKSSVCCRVNMTLTRQFCKKFSYFRRVAGASLQTCGASDLHELSNSVRVKR